MAVKDTDSAFQSTRALLDETIAELVDCLESKRGELSSFIDLIEADYNEKQIELVSDIDQLDILKKQTESIAKNSLSELQQKLIEDINLKINNLKLEAKHTPQIQLSFDKNSVLAAINDMSVLGYDAGGLEFGSDEEVSKELTGKDKKGRKQRGKGKKGKGDMDPLEFWGHYYTAEDVSDTKKKKNKQLKVEKKQSAEGEGLRETAANAGNKYKKEDKPKKTREDKKGSTGDPVPPQGKKAKNKGKGGAAGFDAHALLESELTESL